MEYELFRSKLKPLVDCASIINIIENSSSGEHPHRTAVVGLILERSIEERLKRMSEKASRPDPTFQPKRSTETPTSPISRVQPLAPISTPQLLSKPPPRSISSLISALIEASPDPLTPSEPRGGTGAELPEEPPANTKTNLPDEHTVRLVCCGCNGRVSRLPPCSSHNSPVCPYLRHRAPPLKCAGCETELVRGANSCTNCHGKFER